MPELVKLEPDNLRDTLVEIRYEALYDFSILKGLFYTAFKDTAKATSLLKSMSVQFPGSEPVKLGFPEVLDFHQGSVKFSFVEERIYFNTIGSYPGWKIFGPIIASVLSTLDKLQLITKVSQVGLRYISDHPECVLHDIAHLTAQLPTVAAEIRQTMLRFETRHEEDIVTLTLSDTLLQNQERLIPQAVVDIDVVRKFGVMGESLLACQSVIDALHHRQKAVFVNLLKDEYLTSLNAKFH